MCAELIHKGFEKAALSYPNHFAVIFGNEKITYAQLDREAELVANHLNQAAKEERIIGICSKKSIQTIIHLLAILKSGKAFMPIDPDYPIERQKYMIEISGLRIMMDDGTYSTHWKGLGLVSHGDLSSLLPHNTQAIDFDTAVVLFTSGSTGNPKGVVLGHKGLCNNIDFQCKYPWNSCRVKTLQYAHLAFDGAILEIFSSLWSGGELHLIDEEKRLDNLGLLEYLIQNKINRVFLPNVALQSLIEESLELSCFPLSLTEITTAGEVLKITDKTRHFFKNLPETVLKNAYGPTEASVCVTELVLEGDPFLWEEIPSIGSKIEGVELWVLNDDLFPVKEGEVGDLYISGECLAKGYINRKDLSDEKFFYWESPKEEIIRIYHTGDLAVKDKEGRYRFKGRKDDQVKIRGNRVELGEVEIALSKIPGIKQAVVKPQIDKFGQKFLSGYLETGIVGALDLFFVKKQLKEILPDYMIPDFMMEVEKMPKTSSGKIDKQALPKPEYRRPEWAGTLILPVTPVEKNILNTLKDILFHNELSVTDNFFEFGGNSIKAQNAIAQLRKLYNYKISISGFFQNPTSRLLSEYLLNEKNTIESDVIFFEKKESSLFGKTRGAVV